MSVLAHGPLVLIKPKKINVPFPISSPICHRVGRSAAFFFFSPVFFFLSQSTVDESM